MVAAEVAHNFLKIKGQIIGFFVNGEMLVVSHSCLALSKMATALRAETVGFLHSFNYAYHQTKLHDHPAKIFPILKDK